MNEYVRSAPYFFRPVKRAMTLCAVALILAAAWLPAPLELAADPAHPPNPARSAWFLVWIQELVSHSTLAIYIALVLAAALVALPWLPFRRPEQARWLPPRLWPVSVGVLLAATLVLVLTMVGLLFRGSNWRFVTPF